MGASPIRRRGANRALGNLGRTTLGDQAVGGGHDEILRRLAGQGGKAWERRRSISIFGGLDDVRVDYEDEESEYAPTPGAVPVWDPSIETPFGGAWRPEPSGIVGLGTVEKWSDSGSFSESSSFDWSQAFIVPAQSQQLVIVSARCTGDTGMSLVAPFFDRDSNVVTIVAPSTWKLTVNDGTFDPSGVDAIGQSGTGGGWATLPMWLTNDTDEDRTNTLFASVDALSTAFAFDADVTITARTIRPGA